MNKKFRILFLCVLTITISVSIMNPVSAKVSDEIYYVNISDNELKADNETYICNYFESLDGSHSQARDGSTSWDYHSVKVSSDIATSDTYVGVANGQPAGGTSFGSTGGAFGYTDSQTSSLKSLSISFKVFGILSTGIGLGAATSSGVGQYIFNAPANVYVKLYIYKRMMATLYKNYRTHRTSNITEYLGESYLFSVYSVRGEVY